MGKEIYTRKEVANIFGIRPRTLWHWERRGLINPSFHIGNRPRYSIEAIERVVIEKDKEKSK